MNMRGALIFRKKRKHYEFSNNDEAEAEAWYIK